MKTSTQISLLGKIKMIYIFLLFMIVTFSCSENPTEQKEEPCPPIDLVSNPSYDSPVWHPSGNFIGFNHTPLDSISYPYGKQCIGRQHFNYDSTGFWLINIDGTEMKRVLPFKLKTPAWSPDGKWIVFVLPDNQIYKMPFNIAQRSFDTTKIKKLTYKGRNFFPSWSPDGQWIAYDSDKDSPNGMNFIWKMRSDGSGKKRIAYEPNKGEIREPNWSPDGNKIVHIRYSKDYGTNASEIVEMDKDGGNEKRLTFNNNMDDYPNFSPNSNQIAFVSTIQNDINSSRDIRLIDENEIKPRQITNNHTVHGIFSWSPDGEKIVYTKHNYNVWSYNNGVIWIVDINNRNEIQLTYNLKRR